MYASDDCLLTERLWANTERRKLREFAEKALISTTSSTTPNANDSTTTTTALRNGHHKSRTATTGRSLATVDAERAGGHGSPKDASVRRETDHKGEKEEEEEKEESRQDGPNGDSDPSWIPTTPRDLDDCSPDYPDANARRRGGWTPDADTRTISNTVSRSAACGSTSKASWEGIAVVPAGEVNNQNGGGRGRGGGGGARGSAAATAAMRWETPPPPPMNSDPETARPEAFAIVTPSGGEAGPLCYGGNLEGVVDYPENDP